jgi:spore coat polysaccharide biosynthesis protein SpsF
MRTAIFLSSRNKATRLPGKALLPLAGRPMTARLIERLQSARVPELVVLTTSAHPDDRVLVDLARAAGIETFCGSEDDKLDRYLQAMHRFDVDVAAIVDGDDPLCDPGYLDRLLTAVCETGAGYGTVRELPVGLTANVVERGPLARVCEMKAEHDTEVWGGYFTNYGLFRTCVLDADESHRDPALRLTLDYPEDYQLFTAIFDALQRGERVFTLDELFDLVRARPELKQINAGVAARYEANLKSLTKVALRAGAQPQGGIQ